MSTPVRPTRDRAGRVYKPAIGSRLRPLLWIILVGFALLAANGVLPLQRDRADLVPGDHPADVLLHAHGCPSSGPRTLSRRPVPGLRLRAPGDLVEATEQGRPSASAWSSWLSGLVILVSGLVLVRLGGFEVRDPRVRNVGYWLHVVAPLAAVGASTSSTGWPGRESAGNGPAGSSVAVVGFVVVMGLLHFQDPRSFGVKGPKEGKQYFYPVRGRHGQRQVHPGARR